MLLRSLRRSSFSSLQSCVPAHRWNACVTPDAIDGLLQDGYYVVPDAFPTEYIRHLRNEMKLLRTSGQLYPNSTHILLDDLVKNDKGHESTTKTLLLEKHNIVETELASISLRDQWSMPFLREFFEQQVGFDPLRQALPDWLRITGHMVKVQHNSGEGACFPMHFDSYGDDGKCITAILYLNEEWKQGDGGELVLHPFPKFPVKLQPRSGLLVLFSSQQMLHRVMPAYKPRDALMTWIYHSPLPGDKTKRLAFYKNFASKQVLDVGNASFNVMIAKILRSPFRRHLLKMMYQDEWTQSMHDSHLHTKAFDHYMAKHQKELQVIEAATNQMLANFRAKDGGASSSLPQTKEQLIQRIKECTNSEFVQNIQLIWF